MSGRRDPKKWPAEVRALWDDITGRWRLNEEGLALLRLACEARCRMLAADRLLARQGLVLVTRRGVARAHPAVTVRKEAEATFLRAFRDIGLEG